MLPRYKKTDATVAILEERNRQKERAPKYGAALEVKESIEQSAPRGSSELKSIVASLKRKSTAKTVSTKTEKQVVKKMKK